MEIPYRPLGIITEMIEKMGLEVTYAYEDLVFISHNAFLLRMGQTGPMVHLYFNQECPQPQRPQILEQITSLAAESKLTIFNSGTYEMKPRPDEQIDIHFQENSEQSLQ